MSWWEKERKKEEEDDWPIRFGARLSCPFVWLAAPSVAVVVLDSVTWLLFTKCHFRQKITITQNAANWAIHCKLTCSLGQYHCFLFYFTTRRNIHFVGVSSYAAAATTRRRQDVCKWFPIFVFFFFLSHFYDYDYYDVGKGKFVVDPFMTGLIGWSVHIAIMSWVWCLYRMQQYILRRRSAYHIIRWEFCGKVSPSSLKERLAWACQWFFDVPSPSASGSRRTEKNSKLSGNGQQS